MIKDIRRLFVYLLGCIFNRNYQYLQLKFIAFSSLFILITYLMSRSSKTAPPPPVRSSGPTSWKDRLTAEDY